MALESCCNGSYDSENSRGRKRPCLEDRTPSSIQKYIDNLKQEISCLRKEISSMDQSISDIFKEISQIYDDLLPLEREISGIQQDIAICEELLLDEGSILGDANTVLSKLQESPRLLQTIHPQDPPDVNRAKLMEYSTSLKQVLTVKEPQQQVQLDLVRRKYDLSKQVSDPCWEKKLILKSKRQLLERYTS